MSKLASAYVAGWNAGDADAVAALYAPDAVFTMSDGHTLRGQEEIRKRLTEVMGVKGKLTLSANEARPLGADSGVWRCEWKRSEPKGGSPRGNRLAVVTATKAGWQIVEDLAALSPAEAAPRKAAPHAHGAGEHEHGSGEHGHAH